VGYAPGVHRRLLPLLTLACRTAPLDGDGDGALDAEDCAPADARTFPGAPERCDAVDNDCDGQVDEDLPDSFFADVDGDGFGDADRPIEGCTPPLGAVADAGDCDDGDARAHPGALERCNGIDDDCDGRTDEPRVYLDFEDGLDDGEASVTGEALVVTDDDRATEALRLTRPVAEVQGALWLADRFGGESFAARFRFRMAGAGGTLGEGLAFVALVGDRGPLEDGAGGARLGVYGTAAEGLAVELDPVVNSATDSRRPAAHVGVVSLPELAVRADVDPPMRFDDDQWHELEVTWRAPVLSVTLDTRDVIRDLFVPVYLGELVSLGLTAATSRERVGAFLVDELVAGCPGLRFDDADDPP
jgi:hypothetical protein